MAFRLCSSDQSPIRRAIFYLLKGLAPGAGRTYSNFTIETDDDRVYADQEETMRICRFFERGPVGNAGRGKGSRRALRSSWHNREKSIKLAKPLKGFGGAGVLEVVENFDGDTYRAIYTVKQRLRTAEQHYQENYRKAG